MKRRFVNRRAAALLAVVVPLIAIFGYVALRSGPLTPVPVTVTSVNSRPVRPALFGIGTVGVRYSYKLGPTTTGRLLRLDVHVGDRVHAGQTIGEMDPVDIEERIRSQDSAIGRAVAALREAEARQVYAAAQLRRYEQLFDAHVTSKDAISTKQREFQISEAGLAAAREELARARSERKALLARRDDLKLVSPTDGLVTARNDEPGTTVIAGQTVVEIIDPTSLWIDARFDQTGATGLSAGLPANIVLRSRSGRRFSGHVLRVEPLADDVTEETRAKIVFDSMPEPLPPVGELAEVTVAAPALPPAPVIPNSAIHRLGGATGVWTLTDGRLRFAPVRLGVTDLDGNVQVTEGIAPGDRVVVYSEKTLTSHSRIRVVKRMPGAEG